MKRVVFAAVSMALVFSLCQSALAAGSWRQGKKVFKENCATCHRSQQSGGKLKISEHNREYWSRCVNTPQNDLHRSALETLGDDEIEALLDYLYKYANDGISKKKEKLGC